MTPEEPEDFDALTDKLSEAQEESEELRAEIEILKGQLEHVAGLAWDISQVIRGLA